MMAVKASWIEEVFMDIFTNFNCFFYLLPDLAQKCILVEHTRGEILGINPKSIFKP
jgi:hypothetical protein